MNGLAVIARYEARRLARKKSLYLFILLALLPLPVAFVVRSVLGERLDQVLRVASRLGLDYSRMWAVLLGVGSPPPELERLLGGTLLALGAASLASFVWLVAVLLGGDLLASDIRDKLVHLVLIRPVRRSEYIAAKLVTVTLEVVLLFAVTGVVAFASMQVLLGGQKGLLEALGFSVLIGLSGLPLLFTASALGAYTRNPTLGVLLGVVAYFASAMVVALSAVFAAGPLEGPEALAKITVLSLKLQAYNPFAAGELAARALYAALHEGGVVRVAVGAGVALGVEAGELLWTALPVYVGSTLALGALNWLIIARRDL